MTPDPASRSPERVQRLRARFSRGVEARAIGHLDVTRRWENAFRAAGLVLSYTQGNRPTPRITLAAGLAADATSEGELLDVVLAELTDPATLIARVQPHLPPGIDLLDVREVGLGTAALPTLVRFADYAVDVRAQDPVVLRGQVQALLAAQTYPWVDMRGEKRREYDLRALIQQIDVQPLCEGAVCLVMRLRNDENGVGRPDQVVKALDLGEATRVHRLRLIISETSPARDAWRRRGRYVG